MEFTTTWKTGRYETTAQTATGRTVKIRVEKVEKPNPSARGGATKTVWEASATPKKATGETREEAVRNVAERAGLTI